MTVHSKNAIVPFDMGQNIEKASIRAFSGLSINLSAGWFGATLIIPAIQTPGQQQDVLALFFNIVLGILALLITIYLERKYLQYE